MFLALLNFDRLNEHKIMHIVRQADGEENKNKWKKRSGYLNNTHFRMVYMSNLHGYRQRGQGAWPSWIFIHGTDTVDRGLIVLNFVFFLLFFGIFSVGPPRKRLNSAIFWSFFVAPSLETFSDTLANSQ